MAINQLVGSVLFELALDRTGESSTAPRPPLSSLAARRDGARSEGRLAGKREAKSKRESGLPARFSAPRLHLKNYKLPVPKWGRTGKQ